MNPLLLFGGSFDPVHCGHVAMLRAAMTELPIDRARIFPAGNPYQRGRPPLASIDARLAMLQLAFADTAIGIDRRELDRAGPTYTVDTLRELRREYGAERPLVWLIGADAFSRLDTWKDWQELAGLSHFAVAARPLGGSGTADLPSDAVAAFFRTRRRSPRQLVASACGGLIHLSTPVPPVSSTDIRRRLTGGGSIRGLAPDAVCDYIERHQLYTSSGNH